MSSPFASLLVELRQKRCLSQARLARMMRRDQATISRWENGQLAPPEGDQLTHLISALSCTVSESGELRESIRKSPRVIEVAPHAAPSVYELFTVLAERQTEICDADARLAIRALTPCSR